MLWAVASPYPDFDDLRAAAATDFDRVRLVEAAIRQWVAPISWRNLEAAGVTASLGDAGPALRIEAARWHAKALYVGPALRLALEPLAAAGLEPVVLKGAALVERYPEPSLRPFGDIDMLLPQAQHDTGVKALTSTGWQVAIPRRGLHYETTLVHPDAPSLSVELHADMESWQYRLGRADLAAQWERRRPITLLGIATHALQPEEELLLIAGHAAKPFHTFDRLMWFGDLVVVIEAARATGGIDWELVRRRAREQRATTVLAVALTQARRMGADAPEAVTGALPRQAWRQAVLAPMLGPEWPLSVPDTVIRRRSRYALSDTWGRRALLFIGESAHESLPRQAWSLVQRTWMAIFGFPRLRRTSR